MLFIDFAKNVSVVAGAALSLVSLLSLSTRGGRAFITNLFSRNTRCLREETERLVRDTEEIKGVLGLLLEKFEGLEEVSRQQCRNTIKNIYYRYQKEKRIPLYERKTVDRVYEIYSKKFSGNSYASLLYNEICKWEIDDAATYQDMDED